METLPETNMIKYGHASTELLLPSLIQQGKPIALVGMMGAGKSTVARQLSTILGLSCYDIDQIIERKIDSSIADYFAVHGETEFRLREAETIAEYLKRGSVILALGGGAFIQDQLREKLLSKAICVYLDVPMDQLWQRVKSRKNKRPLIAGDVAGNVADEVPGKTFANLFAYRAPIYAQAPYCITWQNENSVATAQRIKQILWDNLMQQQQIE